MKGGDRPAFPAAHGIPSGLTKREFFAGLAMLNLQNVLLRDRAQGRLEAWMRTFECEDDPETAIAKLAVRQADALLEELGAPA